MHRYATCPPPLAALVIGQAKAGHARRGVIVPVNDDRATPGPGPVPQRASRLPFGEGMGWALLVGLPFWYPAIRLWALVR